MFNSIIYKNKTSYLLAFVLLIFLSACSKDEESIIDYTPKEVGKDKIVDCGDKISAITDFSKVYKVSVEQVQDYVKERDIVVVCEYGNETSNSTEVAVATCRAEGVDILLISDGGGGLPPMVSNVPLLMVDTNADNTKIKLKYNRFFFERLLGVSLKSINYAPYHVFVDGKYVTSCSTLEKVAKVLKEYKRKKQPKIAQNKLANLEEV